MIKWGCKHEWKVVVDRLVESKAERLAKINPFAQIKTPSPDCAHSITILACDKCGKIDKTIVEVQK